MGGNNFTGPGDHALHSARQFLAARELQEDLRVLIKRAKESKGDSVQGINHLPKQ
ncbi:hypothetical protein SUNI508_10459 [Seiridium unicorne]|uniref:Uncharacterized protein n=1 Tax=Seiridium unicorne TaxID=138068 RepID=A0ABR2ULE4_9PEZI